MSAQEELRPTFLDPIRVLHTMAYYGHRRSVERALGIAHGSLAAIACRNWHIQFAIEAGLHIYRNNRERVLRGEGDDVVGPALHRSDRCPRTG